jgi:hypothetical protein
VIFFGCIFFFQNNIETYVYLELCLQKKRQKRQKTPKVLIVKNVTLYAANKVNLSVIAPHENIKSLQSLQMSLQKKERSIFAVNVTRIIHRVWVYGNTLRNVIFLQRRSRFRKIQTTYPMKNP